MEVFCGTCQKNINMNEEEYIRNDNIIFCCDQCKDTYKPKYCADCGAIINMNAGSFVENNDQIFCSRYCEAFHNQ